MRVARESRLYDGKQGRQKDKKKIREELREMEENKGQLVSVSTELLTSLYWVLADAMFDFFYGRYIGGDVRLFSPDEESASERELRAWVEAYKQADAGEAYKHIGGTLCSGEGMSVSLNYFGYGTSIRIQGDIVALLYKVEEALLAAGVPLDTKAKLDQLSLGERYLRRVCDHYKIGYTPTTDWDAVLRSFIPPAEEAGAK